MSTAGAESGQSERHDFHLGFDNFHEEFKRNVEFFVSEAWKAYEDGYWGNLQMFFENGKCTGFRKEQTLRPVSR